MARKTYLGDSVYAEVFTDGSTLLTTNNGGEDSNRIMLEEEVLQNLMKFILKQ